MHQHRRLGWLLTAIVGFGVLAPVAHARDDDVSTRTTMVIQIPEDATVGSFLKLLKGTVEIPLTWNPKDKQMSRLLGGPATLRGTKHEILDGARALLAARDLIVLPIGRAPNAFFNVTDARATSIVMRLSGENVTVTDDNVDQLAKQTGVYVNTSIRVKHLKDLRSFSQSLKRLVTPSMIGSIYEVPEHGTFVISDFAPNVASIYRLIRAADVPSANPEVVSKTIKLRFASAHEAAAVLSSHFSDARASSDASKPAPKARVSYSRRSTAPLRITADRRTNQLLISGAPDDVATVESFIDTIDIEIKKPEPKSKAPAKPRTAHEVATVRLNHASPKSVARSLQMFIGSGTHWGRYRPSAITDLDSATVVLTGTPQQIEILRSVIATLDRERDGSDAK